MKNKKDATETYVLYVGNVVITICKFSQLGSTVYEAEVWSAYIPDKKILGTENHLIADMSLGTNFAGPASVLQDLLNHPDVESYLYDVPY